MRPFLLAATLVLTAAPFARADNTWDSAGKSLEQGATQLQQDAKAAEQSGSQAVGSLGDDAKRAEASTSSLYDQALQKIGTAKTAVSAGAGGTDTISALRTAVNALKGAPSASGNAAEKGWLAKCESWLAKADLAAQAGKNATAQKYLGLAETALTKAKELRASVKAAP